MTELLSTTCPKPGRVPGSISSSPVDSTTTRGLGTTRTRATPDRGEQADLAGPEQRAGRQHDVAGAHVLADVAHVLAGRGPPGGWRPWPARRRSPRPARRRRPRAGIGAPVMIRIDCPGARLSAVGVARPAMSPTTGRRPARPRVAPATSAARTAYPSMAELAKPGRSTSLATSAASTQPCASSSPMSMPGSRRTVPRMRSRCCSTVITTSASPPRRRSRRATSRSRCRARGARWPGGRRP